MFTCGHSECKGHFELTSSLAMRSDTVFGLLLFVLSSLSLFSSCLPSSTESSIISAVSSYTDGKTTDAQHSHSMLSASTPHSNVSIPLNASFRSPPHSHGEQNPSSHRPYRQPVPTAGHTQTALAEKSQESPHYYSVGKSKRGDSHTVGEVGSKEQIVERADEVNAEVATTRSRLEPGDAVLTAVHTPNGVESTTESVQTNSGDNLRDSADQDACNDKRGVNGDRQGIPQELVSVPDVVSSSSWWPVVVVALLLIVAFVLEWRLWCAEQRYPLEDMEQCGRCTRLGGSAEEQMVLIRSG